MQIGTDLRQRVDVAAVYATAAVPLNIVPLLIGALMTYLGLTEAEAGAVMTFELAAMALVAFVLAPMGARLTQAPIALIGCCTIIAATIATTQATSTAALAASRVASGLGAGRGRVGEFVGGRQVVHQLAEARWDHRGAAEPRAPSPA